MENLNQFKLSLMKSAIFFVLCCYCGMSGGNSLLTQRRALLSIWA